MENDLLLQYYVRIILIKIYDHDNIEDKLYRRMRISIDFGIMVVFKIGIVFLRIKSVHFRICFTNQRYEFWY